MSKDTADKTIVMFYAQSFYDFSLMTDAQAGQFFKACLAYAVHEEYEITDPFVQFCLNQFIERFNAEQEKREAIHASNVAKGKYGVLGGRPRKDNQKTKNLQGYDENLQGYKQKPTRGLITSNESQVMNNEEDAKASFVDADGDDDSDLPVSDPEPNPEPELQVKVKRNAKMPDPPYEVILALYKEILPELSQPSVLNAQRKGAINARWRELNSIAKTVEERVACFRKVFENAKSNDWNFGNNERGWKASFDYFMQPKAFNQYLDWQAQPSGVTNMSITQKPWQVSDDAMPTSYEQFQQWVADGWMPGVSRLAKLQDSGIVPSDGSFNKQNTRRA